MLKGLALPRASHSGEIALAGSSRLRSTLAAAPVLFAHAVVTETTISRIIASVTVQASSQSERPSTRRLIFTGVLTCLIDELGIMNRDFNRM